MYNLIKALADIFDVNPEALKVPDIDSYVGLMHTLFAFEDRYGRKIEKAEALESKQITQELSDILIAEGKKNKSEQKKK